ACEVPEGRGLIARRAAAGSRRRHLRQDLRHLLHRWEEVGRAARKDPASCLVHREPSPAVRAVRDLFQPQLERIVVDDEGTAGEVEDFLSSYAPRARVPLERYTRTRPLFEAFDLERDYQLLFRPRVPLPSGASIVIHETEALTAIDVNSGRIDQGSLEQTALQANLLAAREIARQIRLRDLGGILVVDFIDMAQPAHRREVEAVFREALQEDRSRGKPGRLGAFGLMALTRRRLGNGLPRAAESPCLACGGTGSLTLLRAGALRALRRLRALAGDAGRWRLRAHPGVLGILEEELQEGMAALEFDLQKIGDSQVPAGEPVLERIPPSG
ncbi:MAG: ribonuclease E/G, partial [Planctomycetota bacterium]